VSRDKFLIEVPQVAYNVFFSHSSADREWAKWIAKSAGGAGIVVYLYEHDPRPGVQIATKVKQAIVAANSVVVFAHTQQFRIALCSTGNRLRRSQPQTHYPAGLDPRAETEPRHARRQRVRGI
jgi:hypothetical protein